MDCLEPLYSLFTYGQEVMYALSNLVNDQATENTYLPSELVACESLNQRPEEIPGRAALRRHGGPLRRRRVCDHPRWNRRGRL